MSFQKLLRNHWSSDLAELDEQTFFVAELIYGHLIDHFSTPASFTTWPERIPRRIQNLLRRVGSTYPTAKPTIALHAMVVVLSIKEFHEMAVAFYDDVELLFMLAYKRLAQFAAPKLTDNDWIALTDGRYFGTKFQAYPTYLEQFTLRAISEENRPALVRNAGALLGYHLSPFLSAGMKPYTGEIPMMSLFVPLERHEPAGHKQTLVFPDTKHKLSRLKRIVEVEEPDEEAVGSAAGVNDVVYDAASQASSSVVTGLSDLASSTSIATGSETSFDGDSQTVSSASASSSLTMINGLAARAPAGGSKFVEESECFDSPTSITDDDALGSKSFEPSSSALSTSSSKGRVKHNPASQLNAVFSTRERPTTYSAAYSSSDDPYDPVPDLYPNFRAEAREWESRPETFVQGTGFSLMKRLRVWQANRRERKAFAAFASHADSSLGGKGPAGNQKQYSRSCSTSSNRWKRAFFVPL